MTDDSSGNRPSQKRAAADWRDGCLPTILESISEGVFTVDSEWRITCFNRAAEKITGFRWGEAIGRRCYEVMHANRCETGCLLRETVEKGREHFDQAVNIINREGRNLPLSIRTAVLKDEEGQPIGGVVTFRDLSAVEELRKEVLNRYTFQDIISKNEKILEIFSILPDIAESESTVLIEGPSGSGKELFARAIHFLSPRKDQPLVVVNCGALPEPLLESELFGYLKGAFTDAKKDKPGRFALAEGGTLFLDEVGDLSPPMQVKILRVLQEKVYEPLGGTAPRKADVRIIAASHQSLGERVRQGTFREDLYYRLNVVKIHLPSLRERREDIPLLVDHFIHRFNLKQNKNILGVRPEVIDLFMSHDFPGNVRELENLLEHAFILCHGLEIQLSHLPPDFLQALGEKAPHLPALPSIPLLRKTEAEVIVGVLHKNRGNRKKTAQELGIDKSTLWRKMKRLGIQS
ncbi:MAG: sigma 54-interacting transcriptional regulator [Syntrophaceae bacterium]|nr:sigma 54-interacting transcriptional regulator [Syntrophaceae bacterium]